MSNSQTNQKKQGASGVQPSEPAQDSRWQNKESHGNASGLHGQDSAEGSSGCQRQSQKQQGEAADPLHGKGSSHSHRQAGVDHEFGMRRSSSQAQRTGQNQH